MKITDILPVLSEGDVINFPDRGPMAGAMKSLADFLTDPRPIEGMYQEGDVLIYKGEIGEVTSCNDRSLVLSMRNGGDVIVNRRDFDLEVAPPHLWKV